MIPSRCKYTMKNAGFFLAIFQTFSSRRFLECPLLFRIHLLWSIAVRFSNSTTSTSSNPWWYCPPLKRLSECKTVRTCAARALRACEPLKLLLRHTKPISGFWKQKNDCFVVLVCVEGCPVQADWSSSPLSGPASRPPISFTEVAVQPHKFNLI